MREQRKESEMREMTGEERGLSFLIGLASECGVFYLCDVRVTCLHSGSWILSGSFGRVVASCRSILQVQP